MQSVAIIISICSSFGKLIYLSRSLAIGAKQVKMELKSFLVLAGILKLVLQVVLPVIKAE